MLSGKELAWRIQKGEWYRCTSTITVPSVYHNQQQNTRMIIEQPSGKHTELPGREGER